MIDNSEDEREARGERREERRWRNKKCSDKKFALRKNLAALSIYILPLSLTK